MSLLGWLGKDEGGGERCFVDHKFARLLVDSLLFLFFDRAGVGVGDHEQVEVLNTLLDDVDVYSAAELSSRQAKWRS